MKTIFLQAISKKDFGAESRGILEVCRGFSRRINAEFGTKDFFEMAFTE
jgi:hypothetical protein